MMSERSCVSCISPPGPVHSARRPNQPSITTCVNLLKAAPSSSAKVLTEAIPRAKLRKLRGDDILDESKMTGTLMQIYLAYLVARHAASWPSGELLADACKTADGKQGLEVHHFFHENSSSTLKQTSM
jgi:hypothetical protein